ncbi:MAG: hypothetical protein HZB39_08735 [Planctomycetes bacterium]|nr:hypothetical protein [Planctomycetota bacterium]
MNVIAALVGPVLVALTAAVAPVAQEQPRLVVHEWGTFTCLLDDDGTPIGGVNTEDEPLPDFVHRPLRDRRLNGGLLALHDLAPCFFQGAPSCHPDVTMRLETPVLYFHLPAGAEPRTLDVEVAWRGGWLSEFFPRGDATLPGMDVDPIGSIDPDLDGTLAWRNVRIGGERSAEPPATDAPVWLAPRNVAASDVQVGDEAERFLFYRGVGNVEPPLSVVRSADRTELLVRERRSPRAKPLRCSTGPGFLVHVDPTRGCAFRELPPLPLGRDDADDDAVLVRTRATFAPADFDAANASRLRQAMHAALVADGLFADEATALLDTWRVSYFRSPGLRVFWLLPQEWTDAVMPLRLSSDASIDRVMVARIELIDDPKRAQLARLRAGPSSTNAWFNDVTMKLARDEPQRFQEFWRELSGRPGALLELESKPEFGLRIPDDYRAWLALGRFRHALVLEELRARPSDALRSFVAAYGLGR